MQGSCWRCPGFTSGRSDPGVIHKRKKQCFHGIPFCLFPELSPWGHSTQLFKATPGTYMGGAGGWGGRQDRGGGAGAGAGHGWERGLRLGGTDREHGNVPRLRPAPAGRQRPTQGPGIPLPVGRRGFQEETKEEAHLLAGLGNLKRRPVWSGQLWLGVTGLRPRLAPKEGSWSPRVSLCGGLV